MPLKQPVYEDYEAHDAPHHPTPRQYVTIAVVLAVITAIEVTIYYVTAVKDLLVPMLLTMSVIKFALVALWFMHLRFDSHVFRRLFLIGIGLALTVFAVVLVSLLSRIAAPAG
ncbi:MAG: cytochrome C oxidase subunit IV family protein [Actinomycetota bacterium]|nr:cytochrome C oxidase subunit IV family protein [Actinomycetota bacterium]